MHAPAPASLSRRALLVHHGGGRRPPEAPAHHEPREHRARAPDRELEAERRGLPVEQPERLGVVRARPRVCFASCSSAPTPVHSTMLADTDTSARDGDASAPPASARLGVSLLTSGLCTCRTRAEVASLDTGPLATFQQFLSNGHPWPSRGVVRGAGLIASCGLLA